MTSKTKTRTACAMHILKKLIVFLEHATLLTPVPRCDRITVRAAAGKVGRRHALMALMEDAELIRPVRGDESRRVTMESYAGRSVAVPP